MALPTVHQLEEMTATQIRGLLGDSIEPKARTAIQQLEIERQRRKNMPSMHRNTGIELELEGLKRRFPELWHETRKQSLNIHEHMSRMQHAIMSMTSPKYFFVGDPMRPKRPAPDPKLDRTSGWFELKIDPGSDHPNNELLLLLPTP